MATATKSKTIKDTPTAHLNGSSHNGVSSAQNGAAQNGTAPNGTAVHSAQPSMLDKAILLQVDLKRIGNSRSISSECVNADADKDLVRVSKTLLDSDELKAVAQVDEKLKKYLRARCLPSIIRKGVFLLPVKSIEKVTKRLNEFQDERKTKIEAFIAVYPNLIAQAELRLRELFNPGDYPGTKIIDGQAAAVDGYENILRAQFALEWNYVTFGTPDVLAEVSQELFNEERAKMNAQWNEAQEMVQDLLRVRVQEMVQGMKGKLQAGADGKLKAFSKSAVEKMNEFFDEFDALNITDDTQLNQLVEQGRNLLDGVDANDVRKSLDLQTSLKESFTAMEAQLDSMIVNKPKRMIRFQTTESTDAKSEAPSAADASA
jgi:hypothetical protein